MFEKPEYIETPMAKPHIFGGLIRLAGIRSEIKGGETEAVIFDFTAQDSIPTDYRIFLHIYPADGGDMINRDFSAWPPLTKWNPGEVISQRRGLNLPKGKYNFYMGFFNREIGRLEPGYSFDLIIQ